MDGQRGLILWLLGFGGAMLLYAAFTDKSPLAVLQAGIDTTNNKSTVTQPGKGIGDFNPNGTLKGQKPGRDGGSFVVTTAPLRNSTPLGSTAETAI